MTAASLFPMPDVRLVAGVDEAGRGPLAGPVAVAAVILDASRPIAGLNDSKQLSEAKREALFPLIQERALAEHGPCPHHRHSFAPVRAVLAPR